MEDHGRMRTMVRGAYDLQKLRIQMGNRIVGNFKAKLGQEPGESEDELDDDAKAVLRDLRLRYKKLTDGVKTFPRQATFKGDEVISTYTELCLIAQYVSLEESETQHFRRLGNVLTDYPIWTKFLEDVSGIGPAMGGVIISEIDIHKARYPSSIWQYAGLGVESDGRGTSRRKEHLVDVEYTDRDGKPARRKGIRFNPFLKTKLLGVLASSFLRVKDSPYAEMYRGYKHRLESHPTYGVVNDTKTDEDGKKIMSKGRRHNMAMRYMIKQFLKDLYNAWRRLEGLEVAPTYEEAKLGHKHGEDREVA